MAAGPTIPFWLIFVGGLVVAGVIGVAVVAAVASVRRKNKE